MSSRIRAVREACILVTLLAACGCSSATHTVGQLAPDRARDTPAASNGSAGSSSSGIHLPDFVDTGDVTTLDAGGMTLDASDLDPVAMLGEPAFSCRGDATPAARRRLDMFLMVDTNLFYLVGSAISAPLNASWTQIVRGLSDYVDDPRAAGTGVGVGYFPAPVSAPGAGPACSPNTYSMPAAIVEPLPGNAEAIKRSIPAPIGLGSPTLPALEGAIAYSRSRWQSWPYKQVVVLVTDRVADFACTFDSKSVVDAAAESAQASPPVPTYVVALGSELLERVLNAFVRFEALDEVAVQGGTGHVRAVDLDDRDQSLADALLDIQHDAEPCQYEVGPEVAADPSGIALGTVATTGAPLPLPRLDSDKACGEGYYFDDPQAPEWATLCKATCDKLKASAGRSVVWIDECDMP